MKTKINIVEVGPRDGFQNIVEYIPVEIKLQIIDGLIAAGIKSIQITSFVSPKAIPQMKDSAEISKRCLEKYPDLDLFALVPNIRGAQTASELGMKKIANVISLSETHNLANIKSTHVQSVEGLLKIRDSFPDLKICVDVATAFGCPFEGKPEIQKLLEFVNNIHKQGFNTFNICDTIGVANPLQVRETVKSLYAHFPNCEFHVHIHDTRNMGMINTLAAIENGVRHVQTTLGGLGGCPFAPGASGNTASEDLIYMLEEMGYDTGVNFEKILAIAKLEKELIPTGTYSGHDMNIHSKCSVQ